MSIEAVANKMFRKTKLNGKEFQITLLPALQVFKYGKQLVKLILPVVGGGIDALQGNETLDDLGLDENTTFTRLAFLACDKLDEFEVEELIVHVLHGATCDGKEYDINNLTASDMKDLMGLVEFAFKENFYDFFMENPLTALLKGKLTGMLTGLNESQEQ